MARGTESGHTTPVRVPIGDQSINGDLGIPPKSHGIVLFAHGSGSSRHSPRNQRVARALERQDLATLLIDLLTILEVVLGAACTTLPPASWCWPLPAKAIDRISPCAPGSIR